MRRETPPTMASSKKAFRGADMRTPSAHGRGRGNGGMRRASPADGTVAGRGHATPTHHHQMFTPHEMGQKQSLRSTTTSPSNASRSAWMHPGSPMATNRLALTPNSSCSTAVEELEETIADVMGVRMQSLSDLRARIDELSTLHRQEETAFRQQMEQVLQRSELAKTNQLDMEQDFQALLQKERNERQALLQLMQRFKEEGASVIKTMKASLQDARSKWQAEVDLNARLTAQLRTQASQPLPPRSTGPPPPASAAAGSDAATTHTTIPGTASATSAEAEENRQLKVKLSTLKKLIEEEDTIIVELQQRNKNLDQKVAVLMQQRDRLLDLDAQQVETDEFNSEYNQLLNQVRGFEKLRSSAPAEEKVDVLTHFSKMVMQRLLAEQRQRLRVEEQAARMASAQDQLIHSLETRIKELESNRESTTQAYRTTNQSQTGRERRMSEMSASASPPAAIPANGRSLSQAQATAAPPTTTTSSAPYVGDSPQSVAHSPSPAHDEQESNSIAASPETEVVVEEEGTASDSAAIAPAEVSESTPTAVVETSSIVPSDDHAGSAPAAHAPPAKVEASLANEPGKFTPEKNGTKSLEEQLNALTSDFQQSVDQWNQFMSIDGTTPIREQDFLPE